MAFLETLIGQVQRSDAPYIIFTPVNTNDTDRSLIIDEDYISVNLRRLRVVYSRKGTHKYYGCVHSHISLLDARNGRAVFQTVTTPKELKGVSSSNLERVITQDLPFMRAVPYRGELEVELGLMSVQSEGSDLVAPYLDLLQNVSEKAGIGIVQQALTFAQPIQKGLDLLMGGGRKIELEVGIHASFNKTGTWLLMRAPRSVERDLRLNERLEPIDATGASILNYPYMVFSIEASKIRPNYLEIPEIKNAHENLMRCIDNNNLNEAEKNALPYFRRVCIISPDLIMSHALIIIKNKRKRW